MTKVALVAAVVVLAGCGNADVRRSNAYVDAVNRAQTRFAATIDRLSTQIGSGSSSAEDRTTLGGFDRAVAGVVADLRDARPPTRVAPLHSKLVGTMAGYEQAVRRAADALASRRAADVLDAQQRLTDATTQVSGDINATVAQINRRLKAR